MVHYLDAEEEIHSGLSPPKHKPLPLVAFYDSDIAHDKDTKRSIGGVVGMVGKIAIIHDLKR